MAAEEAPKVKKTRRVPYDQKKVDAGAKLVTRDGREAAFVALDPELGEAPLVARVRLSHGGWWVTRHNEDGSYLRGGLPHGCDLLIEEEVTVLKVKVYGVAWVNGAGRASSASFGCSKEARDKWVASRRMNYPSLIGKVTPFEVDVDVELP